MKYNLVNIGISVIVFGVLILVITLILSSLGIQINKECQRQFKDCSAHNGTLSYVECNCKPFFFSSDDCKACYNSAGDWCNYPNGSSIKCIINSS